MASRVLPVGVGETVRRGCQLLEREVELFCLRVQLRPRNLSEPRLICPPKLPWSQNESWDVDGEG